MRTIIAVQDTENEGVYEGLAVELPGVEPTAADLLALEAGLEVQELLEALDVRQAQLQVAGLVDELAERRTRRAQSRVLASAVSQLGGAA